MTQRASRSTVAECECRGWRNRPADPIPARREAVDFDGAHYRVHAEAGSVLAPPRERVPMLIGGNGTRVLQLAGQLADIVGLAGFGHDRNATKVELTHFDAAGLENRIAVV